MADVLISAVAFALDLAVKATVLFAATGVALLALSRASAATRHRVGAFGLGAALLLPFLTLALPRVAVPLLPDVRPAAAPSPAQSADELMEATSYPEFAAEPARPTRRSGIASDIDLRQLALAVPEKALATPEADPLAAPPTDPGPSNAPAKPLPWAPIAVAVWAAGTLALATRLLVGWARVRRISRDALPVRDPEWLEERDAAAARLGLVRKVEIVESPEVPVAMTSGLWKPFLLLGHAARLWAVERKRIVALHELAHVKRGDWPLLLLAEISSALYWFHPLAWWLTRRVRREAEQASDDLVIASGTKPSVYAGHLLGIFRSLGSPAHPVAPALAIARPHHFEERLRAILDPRAPRRDASPGRVRFASASLLAAAVAVALIEPWAPAPAGAAVGRDEGPSAEASSSSTGSHSSSCESKKKTAAPALMAVAAKEAPRALAVPDAEASPEDMPAPEAMPDAEPREDPHAVPAIWTPATETVRSESGFMKASNGKLRKAPRDGDDWYSRGMHLHGDEQYEEAIAAFQRAIDAGYREDASSYNIACGYALLGRTDQAFEWLRKAVDAGFEVADYMKEDDDLDSLRSDSRWAPLLKEARSHRTDKEQRQARAVAERYARIAARNPRSGEPFFHVGLELLRTDQYSLASRAYKAAIERSYRTGTSYYNMACALSLDGDKRGALDALEKALDEGFDQPGLLREDDDLDNIRGEPRFRELAKEAKEVSLPGFGHGWKELRSERSAWRDAAPKYRAYAEKNPQKGRAWFNLGFAALAADEPEESAEAFKKALDLGYRKPTTMYNLACAYARMDQKDAAFDWLFKSLDAGFDSADQVRRDDDLDNLRGDPRYRKAIEIARAKERSDWDEEN